MVEAESETDIERYVSAVERLLPFPDAERSQLAGNLREHLSSKVADHREAGWSPALALQVALNYYGSPEQIADKITGARRGRSRLVGAMSAATLAILGGVAGGFAISIGLYIVSELLLGALDWVRGGVGGYLDDASTRTVVILAAGAALYLASRSLLAAQDPWGGFTGRQIRRFTTPIGVAIVLAFAMLEWTGPLNWITVIVLTLLPVWWIAGSWQVQPPRWGQPGKPALALTACAVIAFGGSFAAGWQAFVPVPEPSPDQLQAWSPHFERIAPATPSDVRASLVAGGVLVTAANRHVVVSVVVNDRAALADWHDLRAEVWQDGGNQGRYFWFVDASEAAPLATGEAQWVDGVPPGVTGAPGLVTLTGTIQLHPTTRPIWVVAALTGVAPDGQRYLIGLPSPTVVRFDGTALDWYQEILAGH